jgi:hypothetical protein
MCLYPYNKYLCASNSWCYASGGSDKTPPLFGGVPYFKTTDIRFHRNNSNIREFQYFIACEEGATIIRIGSAIFGAR